MKDATSLCKNWVRKTGSMYHYPSLNMCGTKFNKSIVMQFTKNNFTPVYYISKKML